MANTLSNKCVTNCCKRTILVQVIAKDVVTCFFGTQFISLRQEVTGRSCFPENGAVAQLRGPPGGPKNCICLTRCTDKPFHVYRGRNVGIQPPNPSKFRILPTAPTSVLWITERRKWYRNAFIRNSDGRRTSSVSCAWYMLVTFHKVG